MTLEEKIKLYKKVLYDIKDLLIFCSTNSQEEIREKYQDYDCIDIYCSNTNFNSSMELVIFYNNKNGLHLSFNCIELYSNMNIFVINNNLSVMKFSAIRTNESEDITSYVLNDGSSLHKVHYPLTEEELFQLSTIQPVMKMKDYEELDLVLNYIKNHTIYESIKIEIDDTSLGTYKIE